MPAVVMSSSMKDAQCLVRCCLCKPYTAVLYTPRLPEGAPGGLRPVMVLGGGDALRPATTRLGERLDEDLPSVGVPAAGTC
jgi:hypothetical protein